MWHRMGWAGHVAHTAKRRHLTTGKNQINQHKVKVSLYKFVIPFKCFESMGDFLGGLRRNLQNASIPQFAWLLQFKAWSICHQNDNMACPNLHYKSQKNRGMLSNTLSFQFSLHKIQGWWTREDWILARCFLFLIQEREATVFVALIDGKFHPITGHKGPQGG
jgi:hypothetical protein